MRSDFGKTTALVLSGGGSRGAYEAGVWQALRELGVRIDMVFGTSVGSINGAMVAQDDFDLTLRLWKALDTSMIFDIDFNEQKNLPVPEVELGGMTLEEAAAYAKEIFLHKGADTSRLRAILEQYVNEDRIRSSAVKYGLVTVEMPGFTTHRLLAEDIPAGRLIDYILASASCFPAAKAHVIDKISYVDGGYGDNLPLSLALEKGAERIIAVDLQAVGYVNRQDLKLAGEKQLTLIKSQWDLGNFLIFDTENSRRILRLGYLDAMKALGVYDGEWFTFVRGVFDARDLKRADAAARIFDLDPLVLYGRDSFNDRLAEAVAAARANMKRPIKIDFSLFTTRGRIMEILDSITKKFSDNSLVLYIAEHIKAAPGRDNIFLSRPALKLMPAEIDAARYLVKYDLI